MPYKVIVSTNTNNETFYCDNKDQAQLLFTMAVESRMFTHVTLNKDKNETEKEWEESIEGGPAHD